MNLLVSLALVTILITRVNGGLSDMSILDGEWTVVGISKGYEPDPQQKCWKLYFNTSTTPIEIQVLMKYGGGIPDTSYSLLYLQETPQLWSQIGEPPEEIRWLTVNSTEARFVVNNLTTMLLSRSQNSYLEPFYDLIQINCLK